jgi:probable rRNA maturation factor
LIVLDPPLDGISAPSLEKFARRVARVLGLGAEISILITDSDRIRGFNRRFRRKDKATDVLSFPREGASGRSGGDIAISAEIASANALDYGHSAQEELKILILHGMLHLAGYDHERDNGEMAAWEDRLRRQLRLPASLIKRTHRDLKAREARKRNLK